MIHSNLFYSCSWFPCLSWKVKLPTVLQKNYSGPTNYLVFQHFCVFELFSTMTIWFWDPYFHTEDNWGTHTQLLQKVWMLTSAPEGKKDSLRAWRWKHLEFEDQGKLNLFFFYKNKTAMGHTGYNTVLGIQYIYTVYIYSYGQHLLYTLQYLQNINCFTTKKN